MSKKPRVTFKLERVAEGDWQIKATHPEAEDRFIKGFKIDLAQARGER